MPATASLERSRLDLPPAYTLVRLRETGDAHAHACRIAADSGAGTFVQVGRFDLVEFAVVLEPEEPLTLARKALFAGMVALGDAIAAHCPPEKEVNYDWPDGLLYDGARIGGMRLAWPEGAPEDLVPDWLVLSGQIIAAHVGAFEPGQAAGSTTLEEEGLDDGRAILESFSRYLMLAFDLWSARGFDALGQRYLERLPQTKAGTARRIDETGDLVLQPFRREPERVALLPALAAAAWYDPRRGGPKL